MSEGESERARERAKKRGKERKREGENECIYRIAYICLSRAAKVMDCVRTDVISVENL